MQKVRTGGFVGTVLGTIAAGLMGGPFIGALYHVAGYAAGLASGDTCRRSDKPIGVKGSENQAFSVSREIVEEDI